LGWFQNKAPLVKRRGDIENAEGRQVRKKKESDERMPKKKLPEPPKKALLHFP